MIYLTEGPSDRKIIENCARSLEELEKLDRYKEIKSGDHPYVSCIILDITGDILRDSDRKEIVTLTDPPSKKNGMHAEAKAIYRILNDPNSKELLHRAHTLITTLEPCSFRNIQKHQEEIACAKLITYSGIKQVIVGSLDPAPEVRGRGINIIDVIWNKSFSMFPASLQAEFRRKNENYIRRNSGFTWGKRHYSIAPDEEFGIDYAPESVRAFFNDFEVDQYLAGICKEVENWKGDINDKFFNKLIDTENSAPHILTELNSRKSGGFTLYDKMAMYIGLPLDLEKKDRDYEILQDLSKWWLSHHNC